MTIKSVTEYSSRPWRGRVRRRYKIVLTDLLNVDHEYIIGPVVVDESDDGTTIANSYADSLKTNELEQYKSTIRSGENPFLNDALWNTRAELLKPILSDALSSPATDDLVINGLPFLSLVADEELMILFGQNLAWVDMVRAKADELLGSKIVLENYTPILGGE